MMLLRNALLISALLATSASAQVTRMQIDRREPLAEGRSFGNVGPYEKLVGSLFIEVDPAHPANQRITDIRLAPRNALFFLQTSTEYWSRAASRRSIQERYPTKQAYLQRYDSAIRQLEEQRLLLPADAAALKRTAEARGYW
jgi:hypothetical protein